MGLIIKELVSIASNRLGETGCQTPKLDAEVLLAFLLNVDKSYFYIHAADPLDDLRCEMFFRLIDQRASGIPVQHLTGQQEFMGLPFAVNAHVLIPRPDTETLVEEAIKETKSQKKWMKNPTVLDLCCGSGAIGISIAHFCPKAKLVSTDISKEALSVAQRNADKNLVGKRIKFLEGDLFHALGSKVTIPHRFDLIVTNPPYIQTDVIPTLQREVSEHEPRIALDGGADGLDFYRKIVAEAPEHLNKKGLLMMEIGHDQGERVLALLTADKRYEKDACTLKDLSGLDRVVKAILR